DLHDQLFGPGTMLVRQSVISLMPAQVPGSPIDVPCHCREIKLIYDCERLFDTLPGAIEILLSYGDSRPDFPGECAHRWVGNGDCGGQVAIRLAAGLLDIAGGQLGFRRPEFSMHSPVPVKKKFRRYFKVADFREISQSLFEISPDEFSVS